MRAEGRRFDEDELWSIADSCVAGLAYMEERGVPHGSVDCTRIFVSNNEYKLNYVQPVINHI